MTLDPSLTHEMVLTLAKENAWSDYSDKAESLFNKWNKNLNKEIEEYFESQDPI